MLREVLSRGGTSFGTLQQTWASANQKLRVVFLSYNNRLFSMITLLFKDTPRVDDDTAMLLTETFIPYGAVVWQTATNPPRAIFITMRLARSTTAGSVEMTMRCSCDPSVSFDSLDENCCNHLTEVLQPNNVIDMFKHVFFNQVTSHSHRHFFGLDVTRGERYPTVHYQQNSTPNSGNLANITHVPSPNYSFYVQFDTDRLQFIPLVQVRKKKIQCLLCRGHRSRRGDCEHELSLERNLSGEDDEEDQVFDSEETDYDDETFQNSFPESTNGQQTRTRNEGSTQDEELRKYCVKGLLLPLLPCKSIKSITFRISQKIEEAKGTTLLQFEDLYGICNHCRYQRKLDAISPQNKRWRTTKLFTLTQKIPLIQVEDWICPSCSRTVYFSGAGLAIFPTRKSYCFTYEVLYYFIHNVCRLGISFRAQYESYHMTQICDSALARLDNFRSNGYYRIEDCMSGRRRCSEAFRKFIECIDISNPVLCKHLFTSNQCERPLTVQEKVLFGYSPEEEVTDKRLQSLVIDGTTAGILHELPNYDRQFKILTANPNLQSNQRFIQSQIFKIATKKHYQYCTLSLKDCGE